MPEVTVTKGEALRLLRTRLGLTHNDANGILNIGKEALIAIEKDRVEITDENYDKIVKAYENYNAR